MRPCAGLGLPRTMWLAEYTVLGLLRLYRLAVSPLVHFLAGPLAGCRFTPTCSVYAEQAIRQHGIVRGGWLTLRRLGRCHPWGSCGHDPVPPPRARPGQPPKGEFPRHQSDACAGFWAREQLRNP
jgi:uncharacterized protein